MLVAGEDPLQEAVAVGRDAVAATPADHPDRAAYLSNLGNSLRQVSTATGSTAAAGEAADIGRQAVAAVAAGHPELPGYLANLATSLRELFEQTSDIAALTEAVNAARRAVSMGAADQPDRVAALSALSGALLRMHERPGRAVELLEQARGILVADTSRLLLNDSDVAPLTVSDVAALRLTAGPAYLSACDTSLTSPSLTDEAIHITGAFHLAGYQHVIGSLWPVSDSTACSVAVDVYGHLTRNGTTPPDTTATAVALHQATRRLRARHPELPMLWAPHTHTGI